MYRSHVKLYHTHFQIKATYTYGQLRWWQNRKCYENDFKRVIYKKQVDTEIFQIYFSVKGYEVISITAALRNKLQYSKKLP